jgi:hypothetical protein
MSLRTLLNPFHWLAAVAGQRDMHACVCCLCVALCLLVWVEAGPAISSVITILGALPPDLAKGIMVGLAQT